MATRRLTRNDLEAHRARVNDGLTLYSALKKRRFLECNRVMQAGSPHAVQMEARWQNYEAEYEREMRAAIELIRWGGPETKIFVRGVNQSHWCILIGWWLGLGLSI